ncbi:Fc.00g085880.m01.CDS01 [Cosmosporella sp. VM-42]
MSCVPKAMFHTFQAVNPKEPVVESFDARFSNKRGTKRINTRHACAECKRRKVRCNGQQPCEQCLSSRALNKCLYNEHRERIIPSKGTLEALSKSLSECCGILRRLYPHHETSSLVSLSREELLDLLEGRATEPRMMLPSPPLGTCPVRQDLDQPPELPILSLDHAPGRNSRWENEWQNEASFYTTLNNVAPPNIEPEKSRPGPSSIHQALRVMLKVHPQLESSLPWPLNHFEIADNLPRIPHRVMVSQEASRTPWSWMGQTLIDAYFTHIHVFVPMIDEDGFRTDYVQGRRCDAPWISLLSMVLAMGSIASTKADDFTHIKHYNRAMEYLTIDTFGSKQLETVQALALIGGYYLHHINRPTVANAVMGATVRMATAMGLPCDGIATEGQGTATLGIRSRTWLSLVYLDTWNTIVMGQPSYERWSTTIHTPPQEMDSSQAHDRKQQVAISHLIDNIHFCKIAMRIHDTLTTAGLPESHDREGPDRDLADWHNGLPWLLKSTEPCAEPLYLSRCIMKWRHQNLRMLLHRPVFLEIASSRILGNDIAAVEICQGLAKTTIEDISREWARNQISCWHAVLFLYQAVMIPLISIMWQRESPLAGDWSRQIEIVLELLEAMLDWSLAARRCREVVLRIYKTSLQPPPALNYQFSPSTAIRELDLTILKVDSRTSPFSPEVDDMEAILLGDAGLWVPRTVSWEARPSSLGQDLVIS